MAQSTITNVAGERLVLSRPGAGERVVMQYMEGARVILKFPPSDVVITIRDDTLCITFPDAGVLVVRHFFAGGPQSLPGVTLPDGRELTGEEFLNEFNAELLRSWVKVWENGIGQYQDDPGELIGGIDRLGSLPTIYWARKTETDDWYKESPLADSEGTDSGIPWNGTFASVLYEDNMPDQNVYERGASPVIPGRITFDPDLESGVTVTSVRLSGFPPGTLLYDGDPAEGGTLLIPDASGVYTLSLEQLTVTGVYVTPPPDSDVDMHIRYEADLARDGGTTTADGEFTIIVDAVADKPDINLNAIKRDYGHEAYTATAPGGVVHVTGNATFYDLDGSELLYILVALPSAVADSRWGMNGLSADNLLTKDAVEAYWKAKGGMDAARPDDDVDAAVDAAITAGANSRILHQYVLIEYDPATGQFTAFGEDESGMARAVTLTGLSVSFDSTAGVMHFTLPVQAPANAQDHGLLHMEIEAVSLEKKPVDGELIFHNNIAASKDVISLPIDLRVLRGELVTAFAVHEDGQPYQYLDTEGNFPSTGPRDVRMEPGYTPRTGMPISMALIDPATGLPPDAAYGEVVQSITIGALPSPTQGTLFYHGRQLVAGETIGSPDLEGFSFLPYPNYSGDVPFNFTYTLISTTTSFAVISVNVAHILPVDSVADLPEAESAGTGRVVTGNNLEMGAYELQDDGWAVQELQEAQAEVTFTVTASFTDLDGSEDGWIDILLPNGFSIPPGYGYEEIRNETGVYARVWYSNLANLGDSNGQVSVDVTLLMSQGASTNPAGNTLTILVGALEKDSLNSGGHSTSNNMAERIITQEVPFKLFPGVIRVEAGWEYEGIKHDSAPANFTTLGIDAASINPDGAPVNFTTSVGIITQVTVMLADPGQGSFFVNGVPVTPQDGKYVFSANDVAGGAITYKSADVFSDKDAPFSYEMRLTDPAGNTYTVKGDSLIVMDAVADAPEIPLAPEDVDYGDDTHTATSPGGVVMVSGSATYQDVDGSELLYLVIAMPSDVTTNQWGFAGLSDANLLTREVMKQHWKNVGGMDAARSGDNVDAVMDSIFSEYGNQPWIKYLMVEYDPATGASTVYGQNASGQPVAVSLTGITASFNASTGRMDFTLPVQAPANATADDELHLKIKAVTVEKAGTDHEYVYQNNIAASEDTLEADIEMYVITGTIVVSYEAPEDGRPNQNQDINGNNPANGSAPRDDGMVNGWSDAFGFPITMELIDPKTNLPPDPIYGEKVTTITIGVLPPASQGIIFYNNNAVIEGQVIPINDPSNLDKFTFLPAENFSGDVVFNFSYVINSSVAAMPDVTGVISAPLHVDSVADLPGLESEGTGRAENGNELAAGSYTTQEDGWAVQTVQPESEVEVTFRVEATFTDLDGSENGWIDIMLPEGFTIPPDSGYALVVDSAGTWARIMDRNLAELLSVNGEVSFDVMLIMGRAASPVPGDNTLTIRAVARETDTLDGNGHSMGNNTATRVITQDVAASLFSGILTIEAGWAYEGCKLENATPNIADLGLAPGSMTSYGAPVVFTSSAGTVTSATITLNEAAAGSFFVNGTAKTPSPAGTFIFSAAELAPGSHITFQPSPTGNLYSDDDVPFSYKVTVTDATGNTYTVTGDSIIAIDAVADTGVISDAETNVGADPGTFDIEVTARFSDLDGSEKHYILIEYVSGWACLDSRLVDIVQIFYSADGPPLQPVSYLEDSGGYGFDLSKAVSVKLFFRIDITEESETIGNAANAYSIQMKPSRWATDLDLAVGTMSEEIYPALNGEERDVANNVAFDFSSVFVNVPDSNPNIDEEPVYEDHMPNQNLGSLSASMADGMIYVTLSQIGEYIDNTAGDIIISFVYQGGAPGTFTFGGVAYSVGDASGRYTALGGNSYQLKLPANAILASSNGFALRYNPPANDDIDLDSMRFTVPIVASGTGLRGTLDTTLDKLVVDAVADKPILTTPGSVTYDTGYTAVESGGSVRMNLGVKFDDFRDGSERHYLVFDLTSGLRSVDLSTFPPGFSWTALTPRECLDQGLGMYGNANYVVVPVSNTYLQAANGVLVTTITVGVDAVSRDSTLSLNYIAVAVDTPTTVNGPVENVDYRDDNNFASTPGSVSVKVNTVTSNPALTPGIGYENDNRTSHLGETESNPVHFTFGGIHSGESLTSITITFPVGSGAVYYNNALLASGSFTDGTVKVEYNAATGVLTISRTTGAASLVPDVQGKLAFVPATNDGDADAGITYTGTVVDTASGMTSTFAVKNGTIIIDAVARQPENADATVAYEAGKTAAFDTLAVTAKATFYDVTDGSEKHYLLIEAKEYFTLAGYTLTQVSLNSDGVPLTPLFNARGAITGWLDPDPASRTDQRAVPNQAETKNYIQIPVDDILQAYISNPGMAQPANGFTVSGDARNGYTVTCTANIPIDASKVPADFTDTVKTGGMAVESALTGASNGASGQEAYLYNNVSYDFDDVTISVAVVETRAVSLVMGSASEQNSPDANNGNYYNPAVTPPAPAGAGILAVCDTPGGNLEANEQITLTFTYTALYKDSGGNWVLPGSIFYKGMPVTDVTVNQATGNVTAKVTLDVGDTASIIPRGSLHDPATAQVDGSNLRFVPNKDTFNENDVRLGYSVSVQDTASGATADLGSKAGTVIIDAVADKPIITGAAWDYGAGGATAFNSQSVSLSLTVRFPDTGTHGVDSETQYVLIQQTTAMSLDPGFVSAVEAAGYHIDLYPSQGELYYRIPVTYFRENPTGSHIYSVTVKLVAEQVTADQTQYPAPKVQALAVVTRAHGSELDVANNTAQTQAVLPDLNFAVVDTVVIGGTGYAYEGNAPDAYKGDYTPGVGALFDLGLVLGNSPTGPGGKEVVTGITFTYPPDRGMLSYHDGTRWRDVPSGGQVPQQYSGTLRFTPYDTGESNADLDVTLAYTVVVSEPASGAQKTITGNYLIIIDAVAEQPVDATYDNLVYGGADGKLGFGETLNMDVSVTFPDFAKSADSHAEHFILIQKPSSYWSVVSTGQNPEPEIRDWTNDGTTYWRIPVNATGPDGKVTISVVLQAPDAGNLLYENSHPIRVGGMTIDRDPAGAGPAPGDQGITNNNNYAYTEDALVPIVWDDEGYRYFTVDPLYENNTPNGNQLDENGIPVTTPGGGKVNLPPTITVTENGTTVIKDVDSVDLTWDPSKGKLIVDGVEYAGPTANIPKDKLDSVHFETIIPNSDEDLGQVTAVVHTPDGDYTETFHAITDAVAQPPTNITATPEYDGGKDAAVPGDDVTVTVSAVFPDSDGSEQHYIFVQQPSTAWGNPYNYDIYNAPDGNTYYRIPVEDADYDPATGVGSAEITLRVPQGVTGTDEGNGTLGLDLIVGGMSQENMTVTDPSGVPRGDEVRDDNNTAFNLGGSVHIVTSTAESTPVVHVTPTYTNSDRNGDGTPDLSDASNVYITGLNTGSDTLSQVVLEYPSGHGQLYYNGSPLTAGPGVIIDNAGGTTKVTITNPAIMNALTTGSAASSAVAYVSTDSDAHDVPLTCTVTVQDLFSTDSKPHTSGATITVDAVARQPDNVTMDITTDEGFNGAVAGGSLVTFVVNATFPDFGDPGVDANHYLAVQQLDGWEIAGNIPPGVVVESYNGVTYYLISADLYQGGASSALQDNGGGSFTFTLTLKVPDTNHDITNAGNIQGGALTIANIPDLPDKEITLDNNQTLTAVSRPLAVGVVETKTVDFVFSPILEDENAGSSISLSPASTATLAANNEEITNTVFTFSGDFSTTPVGGIVGTVIYNGKAFEVTKTADGNATVAVDFTSTEKYDPNADFRMVWGAVKQESDGTVIPGDDGEPEFTSPNHTGSSMAVTSSSTVKDIASNDTGTASGTATAEFTPNADPPGTVSGSPNPVVVTVGNEVSFQLTGSFVDIDGSEQHYLLVEQKPGWTGDYQTTIIAGTPFFMVPVQSTVAEPTVTVILTKPDDLTDTGNDAIVLRIGGLAYDGATGAAQASQTVEISVGQVTATGVAMTTAPPDPAENTAAALHFALAGDGPNLNDEITAITITDLKGGTLYYDDGGSGPQPVTGPLPITLNAQDALAGKYSYLPPAYGSGDYTLVFNAVITDSKTNAAVAFNGQTGTVSVTPVATAPEDLDGSGLGFNAAGHVKTVNVSLEATFNDNDGSEEHFFLVALPDGVIHPAGWTAVSDAALLQAASNAGLSGTVYRVDANAAGKATFSVNQPQNNPGGSIAYAAVSVEKALLGQADPEYAVVMGSGIAVDPTGDINENPVGRTITQNVTVASGGQVNGALGLFDPDGDPVSITNATINGVQLTNTGGAWTGSGTYGDLQINADGSYVYTRTNGDTGVDDIVISLADNTTGTAQTTLTFNLLQPTTFAAPFAETGPDPNAEDSAALSLAREENAQGDGADAMGYAMDWDGALAEFRNLATDEGGVTIQFAAPYGLEPFTVSDGVAANPADMAFPGELFIESGAWENFIPAALGEAWTGLFMEDHGNLDTLFTETAATAGSAIPDTVIANAPDTGHLAWDTALPQTTDLWLAADGSFAEMQQLERLRLESGG